MELSAYISFSGVHGSGKTTLINKLCLKQGYSHLAELSDVSITDPSQLNPYEREDYFFTNMEKREQSLNNTRGICICDRWIGDVLRYIHVFEKTGMITPVQKELLMGRYHLREWKIPDLEFVLTADDETLEERITSRGRPQAEEEIKLAKLVRDEFDEYAEGHKFNREIIKIDTSNLTPDDVYETVLTEINKFIKKYS